MDDNQQKNISFTLYAFLILAILASGGIMTTSLLSGKFGSGGKSAAVALAICLIMLWLTFKAQYTLPRIIIPCLAFGLANFLVYAGLGVHDEAMLLFPLSVALSGVLLGRRGIFVFSILSIIAGFGFAWAEQTAGLQFDYSAPTTTLTLITVPLLMGLCFFMIFTLVNHLQNSLTDVRRNEQELLESNRELRDIRASLEQRVTDRTRAAESARAESESARRDLESQFWLAEGQTELMDALRGDQSVTQLAHNALAQLCKYVGAQAGALFLLDGDKLTLAGSYAYAPRPGFSGEFKLGEGLVGQAAADRRIIAHGVSADTLVISTGLADIKPRQIAAAPFYVNDRVAGVLELATLTEFTRAHLEFWNRISSSLGFAFHAAQARQRLADLLMKSQIQAEELQAQEEELRAANEELQAQAENLRMNRKTGST